MKLIKQHFWTSTAFWSFLDTFLGTFATELALNSIGFMNMELSKAFALSFFSVFVRALWKTLRSFVHEKSQSSPRPTDAKRKGFD